MSNFFLQLSLVILTETLPYQPSSKKGTIYLKYKNLLCEIDKFSSDKFLLLPLIDELKKNITKKSVDFFS